ncbi:MAG TPA: aminomethyl-transferring glycine dehydrogenase subunit GcvPA [Planctomycetota bacterium]|nr:aminomethyl-transferring glycine dehydrogenase subunit GcvPA [Planctomycetota bacterium]
MAYVPHTPGETREMLQAMGLERMEDLFQGVPEGIRLKRSLAIPARKSEAEILLAMERLAAQNRRMDDRPSFLGAGVYRRFIPSAIDYLASRGEFNTSYTPYQPEVSQGTLQAIFEYQTLITRLTGMEIANASMYEAGTALAEAVLMGFAVKGHGTRVLVSEGVHPEYRRVLATYLKHHPLEIVSLPLEGGATPPAALEEALGKDTAAVVIQSPNFFGAIEDGAALGRALERPGAVGELAPERPFLVAVVDPISLAILAPPGSYGADVALGDGQQLGNYPAYGGPTFGFFATRMAHVRKVPGRVVGETRDREGKRGYVLTFQTREQHIRRERATSNICTNQGLCSLRGAMYLSMLGEGGLREAAEASARKARHAFSKLTSIKGIQPVSSAPFFSEFPLRLPMNAEDAYDRLDRLGIGGGLPLGRFFPDRADEMLFAFTEMTTLDDISRLSSALLQATAQATVRIATRIQ